MHIELTTGNDSFRAVDGFARRNVSLQTFVRVADDGEGRKVIPLFAAYQKKLKGFASTSLIQTIPATHYNGEQFGQWFVNRHEVAPGTEILLKYTHRASGSGFATMTEYLLLIADDYAPLYRIRTELPVHRLAAVPHVFSTGRFDIVTEDGMLSDEAVGIWRDFLSLEEEYDVCDLMDPCQPSDEQRYYFFEELDGRTKKRQIVGKVKDAGGRSRVKIRRVRSIKTRK